MKPVTCYQAVPYDFSAYRKHCRAERIRQFGNGSGGYRCNQTAMRLIRWLHDHRYHTQAKSGGWSRLDLAEKLGCSPAYLRQILMPKSPMRPWVDQWLADVGYREVRMGHRGMVFMRVKGQTGLVKD